MREGRPGDHVLALLATTIVFWSLNVTVVKSVVDEWQPLAYSVDRFVIGSVISKRCTITSCRTRT